jgi:predicted RND superfamily exporter protein
MIFSVRSLKFGLISLVPNLLPALMTFGIWGAFSGQVNLAVAVVYSVSIGIIVDDTVHFFAKYLRARRKLGLSPEDSLRYSYSTVGSALFVTTAVLTLGFLVLTLSHFTVNVIVGGMTAMTIAIGLAFDMLFLPSLLLRLDRAKS